MAPLHRQITIIRSLTIFWIWTYIQIWICTEIQIWTTFQNFGVDWFVLWCYNDLCTIVHVSSLIQPFCEVQLIIVGNVLQMCSKARGNDPISKQLFFDILKISQKIYLGIYSTYIVWIRSVTIFWIRRTEIQIWTTFQNLIDFVWPVSL